MIYFSPTAIRLLVERLTHSLAPGGFLFLGPSETLRGISQQFHLRHTQGAFYYQRKPPSEHPTQAIPAAAFKTPAEPLPQLPAGGDPNWIAAIAGASGRIAALASQSRATSREMGPGTASPQGPGRVFPSRQDMQAVHELLRQERFGDALRALDALPGKLAADPDTLLLQAVLLVNSGELDRAEQVCEQLLAKNELSPGAHYLLALCQEKRGAHLLAAEHDQTAIYLDEKFAMPRLHLGLLARHLGDLRTARRQLSEALALLRSEGASRILLFGGGFSREELIRFGRAQLELCGGGQ